LATLVVCPRCQGSLPAAARSCPRCGLIITGNASLANGSSWVRPANSRTGPGIGSERDPGQTETVEYGSEPEVESSGTTAHAPSRRVDPVHISTDGYTQVGYAAERPPMVGATPVVPRGAVELLPDESVAFQLGALYLTNKRVILLAPSMVRAAFLRDVDAVGTHTERASGWSLFFCIVLLGLSGAALYAYFDRAGWEDFLPWLYLVDPLVPAALFAVLALLLGLTYFLWIRRTLFVSVSGRPLITVSISEWNSRKLVAVDAFVNAFFQLKNSLHQQGRE
jgi:hypothetical protein